MINHSVRPLLSLKTNLKSAKRRNSIIMVSILSKKKGRNLSFSIGLTPPITYPSQEIRWKIYGQPLSKIFNKYFDETTTSWYRDNNQKLDLIIVTCYGANFSYKKEEEHAFTSNLIQNLSLLLIDFFNKFETKESIVDVMEPIPETLQEFSKIYALVQTNFEKYKGIKLYRKIF